MKKLFAFDQSIPNLKGLPLIGIDEVGRGPLAGPVVVAAVSFPKKIKLSYLDDSKKLSKEKRKIVSQELCEQADYQIVSISSHQIDEINILQATLKAMRESVLKLNYQEAYLLIDGNQCIDHPFQQESIVKGDSLSALIAAASILAKVYRDGLMEKYDVEYPEYGFAKHKGYATAFHREQIKKYGACPIHRQSFLGNIKAEMNQMKLSL